MAFSPYSAEAVPGTISTLLMSKSLGPNTFPIGPPMCGAWLSTPSTSWAKRTLVVLLKPRALMTLKPRLGVITCTPLRCSMASKNEGAGVRRRARGLSFSTVTGACRKLSSIREAVTTTSPNAAVRRAVSAGATGWAGAARAETTAPASSAARAVASRGDGMEAGALYLQRYNAPAVGALRANPQGFGGHEGLEACL